MSVTSLLMLIAKKAMGIPGHDPDAPTLLRKSIHLDLERIKPTSSKPYTVAPSSLNP